MLRFQGDNKIIIANNKKITDLRCFLDIDGVVSFWEKAACKSCQIDIEDKEIRNKLKSGTRLETLVGGERKLWDIIDKEGIEWWENIEKLPWADDLVNLVKKEINDFCFLSSPSNNPLCAAGKIKWLRKHYGDKFKDFLIGRNKHLCASDISLLIDDSLEKTKKFRKYGGHVFDWPSALKLIDNDINVEDVLSDLLDHIKELKN